VQWGAEARVEGCMDLAPLMFFVFWGHGSGIQGHSGRGASYFVYDFNQEWRRARRNRVRAKELTKTLHPADVCVEPPSVRVRSFVVAGLAASRHSGLANAPSFGVPPRSFKSVELSGGKIHPLGGLKSERVVWLNSEHSASVRSLRLISKHSYSTETSDEHP